MANWTFEQQAAIELRGTNLLISAAAGSGKTAVLVERIIRLVLSREAQIHKLLIVTYTNAAASEMRGRIESALAKAIEENETDAAYLNEQIKLLNRASIKTFHAFCLDIIRSNFQKIDCDPSFKLMGDPERVILVRQAIAETFEAHYEQNSPAFINLVEAYSGNRNDERLIEMVLSLHSFIQSQPYPSKWLDSCVEAYSDESHPLRKQWIELLRSLFVERLSNAIDLLGEAITLCMAPNGPSVYIPTLESDIRGLERLIETSSDFVKFGDAVTAFKFDRIAAIKKNEKEFYDSNLIVEVKDNIRDKIIKKQVFEGIRKFFDYKSADRFETEISTLKENVEQLCVLTLAFSERYKQLKKKRNVMDFNDLEHFAIEILDDETVAGQIKAKFDAIFVDEYQDSSGIQEHIVGSICKSDNVFMVGDVKQSIYKFRLADPDLFIEKYKRFIKLDDLLTEEEKIRRDNEGASAFSSVIEAVNKRLDGIDVRVDLKRNFRTRDSILHTVNHIFENIMSEKLGEIDYDEDAKLYSGMSFEQTDAASFEINVISKKGSEGDSDVMDEEDDGEDELSLLKTEELEALAISGKIKSLIGTPIYDPKGKCFKPCAYRDIVILLRSSRSWTPTFEQIFINEGIPLYADSQSGYFDTLEIKMIMALLRIVDNPLQDLPLLTILRSPLVGLTLEEILRVKTVDTERTYYYLKCVKALEQLDEKDSLRKKLSKFLSVLETLREKTTYMPLDAFLWHSMQLSDFFYYVSAMPGGVSRQANLKLLVDRASALKSSRIVTLAHFIEFVDNMSTGSGDYGVASVIGEADNVVRLMSIHKSKGLEFPVVMISGLGRKFNFMDASGDMILHKKLGIGLTRVDLTLRAKSKTLPQFAMREQIRLETLSEEMRVLYVGLTRPVDRLILFATVSDYDASTKKWARGINQLSLTGANGFIDWIMPVVGNYTGVKIDVHQVDDIMMNALDEAHTTNEEINRWLSIAEEAQKAPISLEETVSRRLAYEPAFETIAYKPIKISVTEKTKGEGASFNLFDLPKFIQADQRLSAAEAGTAMHTILERLDFDMPSDLATIGRFIDGLVSRHIMADREISEVDVLKVKAYLESDFVKRVKASKGVYRETPFVLKMDGQLVQGIIDLYFEEEDGLVLVDYKTDRLAGRPEEDLVMKYAPQLEIYEKALVKLTQKTVKEKYIYFMDQNIAKKL